MKGFGESLNRLWSAAARNGAARRQHASDSEAGGRILSSRPDKGIHPSGCIFFISVYEWRIRTSGRHSRHYSDLPFCLKNNISSTAASIDIPAPKAAVRYKGIIGYTISELTSIKKLISPRKTIFRISLHLLTNKIRLKTPSILIHTH